LLTIGSERRALFTTAYNICGVTTVCSVNNSCGLTTSRTGGRIKICTHFAFDTENLPRVASGGGFECSNRIRDPFLIVFRSSYGSIFPSFRDMTTGRTTDNRRRTDDGNHCISGPIGGANNNRW